jgi:hypothetical protein
MPHQERRRQLNQPGDPNSAVREGELGLPEEADHTYQDYKELDPDSAVREGETDIANMILSILGSGFTSPLGALGSQMGSQMGLDPNSVVREGELMRQPLDDRQLGVKRPRIQ